MSFKKDRHYGVLCNKKVCLLFIEKVLNQNMRRGMQLEGITGAYRIIRRIG